MCRIKPGTCKQRKMNQSYRTKINSPPHHLCQDFTYNKILPEQTTDKAIKLSDTINGPLAWTIWKRSHSEADTLLY